MMKKVSRYARGLKSCGKIFSLRVFLHTSTLRRRKSRSQNTHTHDFIHFRPEYDLRRARWVGKGGSGKDTSFLEREKKERKTVERERERVKNSSWTEREREKINRRERAATEIFEKKAIRDRALRLPDTNERLGIETQNWVARIFNSKYLRRDLAFWIVGERKSWDRRSA